MLRLTLLTLASLTMLTACTQKDSQTEPLAKAAPDTPTIEQPEFESTEVDDTAGVPDRLDSSEGLSWDEDASERNSVETQAPDEIDELADSSYAASAIKESLSSNPIVDNAEGNRIQYTVRAGDTLGRIALSHQVTVASIVRANNISDVNAIRIGQRLNVDQTD